MCFCKRALTIAAWSIWGTCVSLCATLILDTTTPVTEALQGLDAGVEVVEVTGEAPASAIRTIAEKLPALKRLDMGALKIVPPEVPEYCLTATGIDEIVLPCNARTIGEGALAACEARSVTLPAALDSIGPYALAHCHKLTSIEIPANTRTIAENALADTPALTALSGGEGLREIDDMALAATGLSEIDLSGCHNLARLGEYAMTDNLRLTTVRLPEKPGISLGKGVWMHCPELCGLQTGIIRFIPDYAMAASENTECSQILAAGATEAGAYALSGNRSRSIKLPATLRYLGDHAMERMNSLTELYVSTLESVPGTGAEVWAEVTQANVDLVTERYMSAAFAAADQWSRFRITTSDSEMTADDTHGCRAWFSGQILTVEATEKMTEVTVYDTQGRIRHRSSEYANHADIDTSSWAEGVYVVRAVTAGGLTATFTLLR